MESSQRKSYYIISIYSELKCLLRAHSSRAAGLFLENILSLFFQLIKYIYWKYYTIDNILLPLLSDTAMLLSILFM